MSRSNALHSPVPSCVALLLLAVAGPAVAQTPPDALEEVRQAMAEASGGRVELRSSRETGLARFVKAPLGVPVTGATAEDRALAFLTAYGKAFGLTGSAELRHERTQRGDRVGMDHVRYRQLHEGVPVTGGELVVHLRGSRVTAVNGRTLARRQSLETTPSLAASAALAAAAAVLAKHHHVTDAALSTPRLEVFDRGFIGGQPSPVRLAWFVEATRLDLRRFLWVDAHTGSVLLDFSQRPSAKSRKIYDGNNGPNLPGALVRNEGQGPTGDPDADLAYDFSGDTYDYFFTQHGRDSYDGLGTQLKSTVHHCPGPSDCPFQNAFWNGTQMVYGEGFSAADDVDAHELTHAVTDTSASLFYYMQSGALNESFSDIFGETVDLLNGAGNDTPGARWYMGEDVPGLGALRNMMNPNEFGDPNDMSDPFNFKCADSVYDDSGGVHSNSGVPNHAYALMVDGGTFNGITVTSIGLLKAGLVQYRSLTSYLTSASDFLENYDALNQSCQDLIGTGGITLADCNEVEDALDAVQMSNPWPCSPAQPPVPNTCSPGLGPVDLFADDFESTKSGNWTTNVQVAGDHWKGPPRVGTPAVYNNFYEFATSGQFSLWGYDAGAIASSAVQMTKSFLVPAGARMQFNHSWGFENDPSGDYDGGVIEYSTNNGASWTDAGGLIDDGAAYNGTISTCCSNPLGGRSAFIGESWGYTATQLNLSSLVGQSVRFRFRIGTDSCCDDYGWFIDDVRIYTCDVGGTVEFAAPVYVGSEAGGTASITVSRSGGMAGGVTVDYFSAGGTATPGADYTPVAGTLSFSSGVTSQSFNVPIVNDTVDDDSETVGLSLTNVVGPSATLGSQDQATLMLTDNDTGGTLQFKMAAVSVGETGPQATITVTRSGGNAGDVTVHYQSADGTATSPGDYSAVSGTLTFAANVTSRTFTVPIVNDTLDEANETLTLSLDSPGGGAVLGGITVATLTITDNDSGGTLQIGAAAYTIGEGGGSATITVTRSGGTASNVTVQYATANGTATAGADYTAASGTLSFGANVMSQTFSVPILEDVLGEANETVLLAISNPTGGATLGARTSSTLTITENESVLQFSVALSTVAETSPKATITVKRSGDTSAAVTVDYTTADGSAVAGQDYVATSGTLSFPAKATSKTFTVSILNDAAVEGTEVLALSLQSPAGGVLGPQSSAALTITDDEAQLAFSVSGYSGKEGGPAAVVTVKRVGNKTAQATVDYATSNGTATAGSDYTATSGTLTIPPGSTSKTFSVPILNDGNAEPSETVNLTLSNPTGASLGLSAAVLTITDDEPLVGFSVAAYNVSEAAAAVTITVKRTGSTAGVATVDYATSNGTATAGADYTAATGTLTFAAKIASRTFSVPILPDAAVEPTETVNLTLSNPTGAGLGLAAATLNITDNDPSLGFSAAGYTAKESAKSLTVTVKRSGDVTAPATVDFATSDGTATAGADYTAGSGTLSFAAKVTSRTFSVLLLTDTLDEADETINLALSNPSGGVLGQSSAAITITDDDTAGTVELAAPTFSGSEAGGSALVTVKRSGGTASGASVQYATSDGTAEEPGDYTETSGTLTFAAGEMSRSFSVPILADGTAEATETINVTLGNPGGGATLGGQTTGVVYVVSSEVLPVITVDDSILAQEGNTGTRNLPFFVFLTPAFAQTVTVDYATADGTAAAPGDYTATSGTLTFTAGQTLKIVNVPVVGDTAPEANETLFFNLSNATNAAIADAQGLGTIDDDDVVPSTLSIDDVAKTEGNSGTSNATFTVTLSPAAAQTVTVQYATANGTASAPSDYTSTSGTLTFNPAQTSKTINVPVVGDTNVETNETFFVNLSNPTNAVIGDGQGQGTINNDDCADSDGDRLCNAYETDTGVYVSPTDTGTDPNDADTDDDELPDGDEVLGTLAGLNLPAMGTSPLKQNILLEYDWMNDSAGGCGSHSHRPTAGMVNRVSASFASAPVNNPDGTTGIAAIHDYGQGGAFTGGNLISGTNISGGVNGADFQNKKAAHFASNRNGYFHYVINPHEYSDAPGSSGQAELPGDDLIVSLGCFMSLENTSNTILHELGHNLNLRHGGNENCNWKPNYNSVMNYRFQFPGVDTSCDAVGSSGEANTLDYSHGSRIALNENNLNENNGVCGSPGIDWNFSGGLQTGVVWDLNQQSEDPGPGTPTDNFGCVANFTTLNDYDDWANIFLGGLSDSDGKPLVPFTVIDCVNPMRERTRPGAQ